MAERMPPQEPKESDARDDSAEQHPPTRPAPTESEIDHEDPVPQGESVQTPGALQPGTGARKGKRVAANVDGAMQGHDMYAIGSFPPGSSYPPGAHALRPGMAFPHGGQTKKHKKLMMQQQQQFEHVQNNGLNSIKSMRHAYRLGSSSNNKTIRSSRRQRNGFRQRFCPRRARPNSTSTIV